MNYFELFEMPVSLLIDRNELSKKYFELQKKYHPDFFSKADESKQAEMLEKSSMINHGYKIFTSADETIKYVLRLKGLLQENEKYELPENGGADVLCLASGPNGSGKRSRATGR